MVCKFRTLCGQFALLTILMLFPALPTGAVEHIDVEYRRNPRLLPYDLTSVYSLDYSDDRKGIMNPIKIFRVGQGDSIRPIVTAVYNKFVNEDAPASFALVDYSARSFIEEDPLYITIKDYQVYYDRVMGQNCIGAGCYRHDSAFVARNVPGQNRIDLLYLTSGIDYTGNGEWEPAIYALPFYDYDHDDRTEGFFYVGPGRDREPRLLACIEMEEMRVEWTLPVASFLIGYNLFPCYDDRDPAVLFATYGPQNGVRDDHFSDRFGYLTKVNNRGEIVFNRAILSDYYGTDLLPLDDSGRTFALFHMYSLTQPLDTSRLPEPNFLLSIIDSEGQPIRSIAAKEVLKDIWKRDYDDDGRAEIFSIWGEGIIRIYDINLTLLAESDPTPLQAYLGSVRFPGEKSEALIFNRQDGVDIYRPDFTRLAALSNYFNSFHPLRYDNNGAVSAFLLGADNCGYFFQPTRKGWIEQLGIIIWEYDRIIIAILGLLLLALAAAGYLRVRAQRALRQSEERYRTLVEGAGEAVFTLDRNGNFLFLNRVAAERMGGTPENLVGMNMFDFFPADIAQRQLARIHEIVKTGRGGVFETTTWINSEPRRYSTSLQPIRGKSGRVEYVMGIANDVTTIHETHQMLTEARDFSRTILDSANSLIVCLDNRAGIKIFNRECEIITGYSRDEVLGKCWPEMFLPPEDRHVNADNFEQWVRHSPTDTYEGRIVTRTGEIKTILWSTTAIFSPHSDELTAIGIGHDVTEKKRSEEARRESETMLRTIFDSTLNGIVVCDLDLVISQANPAALQMFGYDSIDLIRGRSALEFISAKEWGILKERTIQTVEIGFFREVEYTAIGKGGREFPVELNAAVLKDSAGKPVGFVTVFHDISQRKRRELHDRIRLQLLYDLRAAGAVDRCLELACRAISEAGLYKRAVLTLHNDRREIINLGQVGLNPDIVAQARRAPAPNPELARLMTQEKFRIGRSYFIPVESGLLNPDLGRIIAQEETIPAGDNAWKTGDEFFVPIVSDRGQNEGWLSVDTPFDGQRPDPAVTGFMEEILEVVIKKVHEIQVLEKLSRERQYLAEINLALQQSEARYRNLVESAQDVIFSMDLNGNLISLNPAFENITGWLASEWLGKSFRDIIAPDDIETAETNFRAIIQGQSLPIHEYRVRTKSGKLMIGEFVTYPQIQNKRVVAIQGIVRDITQRIRMEKELRESEVQFRDLAEHSLQGIFVYQDGEFVFINRRGAEMVGIPAAELLGCSIPTFLARVVHPDELDMILNRHFTRVAGKDVPSHYDVRIKTSDNQVRWVEVSVQETTFKGRPARQVLNIDITERKKAELALKYRLAFEELVTGISTEFINLMPQDISSAISAALKIVGEFAQVDCSYVFRISEDARTLDTTNIWMAPEIKDRLTTIVNLPTLPFGWSIRRLQKFESILVSSTAELPAEAAAERQIIEELQLKSLIIVPIAYGGSLLGALGFASMREKKNWDSDTISLLGLVGQIFANALEREEADKQLQRINQEKIIQARQIAGGFAHEIRNALFPAKGSLSLIKQGLEQGFAPPNDPQNLGRLADDSVSRAIGITELISRYTKLDSERQEEIVSVNQVFDELRNLNQIRLQEQRVTLKLDIPPDVTVASNAKQLFMALNNLLLNSLDALAAVATPSIEIRGNAENGFLTLHFLDNGCGIPPHDLQRVFTAFFSTKPDRGTGIGLATARKIFEMYGGSVTVSSQVGQGTCFNIKLKLVGGDRNNE